MPDALTTKNLRPGASYEKLVGGFIKVGSVVRNGDVLIGRTAPGTDSYEQNRNLVLSEGTRADSIPNLEIETGDILGAGHASATGRFDDEHLFYLESRGIPEEEARRIVVLGFLSGALLGVMWSRSGTWNRSGGSSGGGG